MSNAELDAAPLDKFPQVPFTPGPNWFRLELLARRSSVPHGTVLIDHIVSDALQGNALNDPVRRPILVYLPDRYRTSPNERFPVVYLLHGAMTDVGSWLWRGTSHSSLIETIDSVVAAEGDAIVVMADAWTSVGGSQYVNSPLIGRYRDYIVDDVVRWVDESFRTLPEPGGRAILGHSSGGFGAWVACTQRSGTFGVLGMLAADCLFEGVYLTTLGPAVRRLREHYRGSMEYFWSTHWIGDGAREARIFQPRGGRGRAWEPDDSPIYDQNMLAMAFARPDANTAEYLFRKESGEIDERVWSRWLTFDPVRSADLFLRELNQLSLISVAAASNDEYYADNGAAALSGLLADHQISHEMITGYGTHQPGELFQQQLGSIVRALRG